MNFPEICGITLDGCVQEGQLQGTSLQKQDFHKLVTTGAFVGSLVGKCPCLASSGIPVGLPGAGMPWKFPELVMRRHSMLQRFVLIGGAGQAM